MKEDSMIITKVQSTITEGEFLDVLVQTILNQLNHAIEDKTNLQQLYTNCHNDEEFTKHRQELYRDNDRQSDLAYRLIRNFDRKYRYSDNMSTQQAKRIMLFSENLNREYHLLANQLNHVTSLTSTN